jgi:hypothetical protein
MKTALMLIVPLTIVSCLSRTAVEDPRPGPVLQALVLALEDGETRTVRVSVLVECDLAEARTWFLDEKHLERWLAEEVEFRPEVGAPVLVAWPTFGEQSTGEVVGVSPGEFLELRLDSPAAGETHIRLSGAPAPGGTRVEIEQWPFPGDARGQELAEAHRRGWFRALQVLRAAIERGLPTTPAPPPGRS